ncbi:hypothetical protein C8D70_11019 [Chryseobacterium sp. CBTAP 102]|nr:hypothetical protein C8D70_11019 [Chryseobacterium sp. CBTAP 102]
MSKRNVCFDIKVRDISKNFFQPTFVAENSIYLLFFCVCDECTFVKIFTLQIMMNRILFCILLTFICFHPLLSQVGINTSDPKATLDVNKNASIATPPPGIIAPRLTGDEIKTLDNQYTIAQKGAIVYATSPVTVPSVKTVNITSPCYYFFDGAIWENLGQCSDPTNGSDIIKAIYTGTAPDPSRTVSIGDYRFRFGNVSGNFQPQIALINQPAANKNVYIGFNQQYAQNGFEYNNWTRTFTQSNYSTYQNVTSDVSNNIVNYELNIVNIVDVEANGYYRVTFYISGPPSGAKAFIIVAEKF